MKIQLMQFLRALLIHSTIFIYLFGNVSAQTVLDKIKDGANKAGSTIGKAANSVGTQ
ncbi:MAG: hypothetical protein N2B02_01920 [Amylibacter sp.]